MMTEGTLSACHKLLRGGEEVRTYRAGYPFEVEDLEVEPFITVHDAVDPVAVAVRETATGLRLGIATDLGRPTLQGPARAARLRCADRRIQPRRVDGCGPPATPASVKARIASSHGHLSNQAATRLVLELLSPKLTVVVLAHLSEESNTPAAGEGRDGGRTRREGIQGDGRGGPSGPAHAAAGSDDAPRRARDRVSCRSSEGPGEAAGEPGYSPRKRNKSLPSAQTMIRMMNTKPT